jgi:hypothetical protein
MVILGFGFSRTHGKFLLLFRSAGPDDLFTEATWPEIPTRPAKDLAENDAPRTAYAYFI